MMRHLTARSVKSMLSRAGINYDGLEVERTDRSATHTGGAYKGQYVEKFDVRVSGGPDARREARHVLSERGLELAPFPTHDDWSRGPQPIADNA